MNHDTTRSRQPDPLPIRCSGKGSGDLPVEGGASETRHSFSATSEYQIKLVELTLG